MATNSLHYPNTVLKKAHHQTLKAEAERLWQLQHPNIVRVYAYLDSSEVTDWGFAAGDMPIYRLGPSLRAALEENQMYVILSNQGASSIRPRS